MTTSCLIVLGISLLLYLTASLLMQIRLWWAHASAQQWSHRVLITGT
jgi:hypothetical protein